tara:strand:+ start:149 stop:460 length:312 start_codon:yes stop_codon:yes gene_type:complete
MGTTSENRKQKRHYLKQAKKKMSTSEFLELKKALAEQGKESRIELLKETLEKEQETLGNQEAKLREGFVADGMKKKDIDKKIEDWYDSVKIWSLHSDVRDQLI